MLVDILGYNPQVPTQVGTLRFDVVRSCEYQYDQEVSGHPVENGFEIHDNAVNKPMRLTMTAGISSHPVTWFYVNGVGKSKFADAMSALETIRDAKQPVTIVRPDRIFTDMFLISARPVKSDESRSIIWIDLSFQKIDKVTVQTAEIPKDIVEASVADSAGETAADGGQATQTDIGDLSAVSTDTASSTTYAASEVEDNRTLAAQISDSDVGQKAKGVWNKVFGG